MFSFFRKSKMNDAVYAAYNAIVAQSRQAVFFEDWGIEDNVTGRFDVLSLHLALVLRRLRKEGATHLPFSQALFDLFFKDMDRSLREMGTGDMAIPKKIQKMGELLYGLVEKLEPGLAANDPQAIASVLIRNFYSDDADVASSAAKLATYTLDQAGALDEQPAKAITSGQVEFGALNVA